MAESRSIDPGALALGIPSAAMIERAAKNDGGAIDSLREYLVDRFYKVGLPPNCWEKLADETLHWLAGQGQVEDTGREKLEERIKDLIAKTWRELSRGQGTRFSAIGDELILCGDPSRVVTALAYFGLPAAKVMLDACTDNDKADFAHPRNAGRYRTLAILSYVGQLGIGEVARVAQARKSMVKKAHAETAKWLLEVRLLSRIWRNAQWQQQFPSVPPKMWERDLLRPWDLAQYVTETPEQVLAMLPPQIYERLVLLGHYEALNRILSAMADVGTVRNALQSRRGISCAERMAIARLQLNLGKNCHNRGQLVQAEAAFGHAASLVKRLRSVNAKELQIELASVTGRTFEQKARLRIEPTGTPDPEDADLARAQSHYSAGVELAEQMLSAGDLAESIQRHVEICRTYCRLRLGNVARLRGRFVRARQLYLESLLDFLRLQYPVGLGHVIRELGNWFLDRARILPAGDAQLAPTCTSRAIQAYTLLWDLGFWLAVPEGYSRGMVDSALRAAIAARTANRQEACNRLTQLADHLCRHVFQHDRSLDHLWRILGYQPGS